MVVHASGASKFIVFSIPADPKITEAFGLVAIRHAQLDRMLKMIIKFISGVTVDEAVNANSWTGSYELLSRINKLAKKRFGEGVP